MGQATWQSVSQSVYVFGKQDKDTVLLLFSYFITLQFYGQYSSTNLFILMSLAQFKATPMVSLSIPVFLFN